MEVSAEIRWFWQGAGPAGLQGWFNLAEFHDCAAGGGGMRTDAYLSEPQQAELGIKLSLLPIDSCHVLRQNPIRS
jgi:hypothetical protein